MTSVLLIACDSEVCKNQLTRALMGVESYLNASARPIVTGDLSESLLSDISNNEQWEVSQKKLVSTQGKDIAVYIRSSNKSFTTKTGEGLESQTIGLSLQFNQRFHPLNTAAKNWMRTSPKHHFFSTGNKKDYLPEKLERFQFFPFGFLYRDEQVGPINEMGFRIPNSKNLKSLKSDDLAKLICIFGGSAAFSINCFLHETFSARLENYLNEQSEKTRYRVLNFAQHAHVVLNELQTYLIFAQELEPDLVIAHDGYNDLLYGANSDPFLLQQHAVTYHINMESWADILAGKNESQLATLPEELPIRTYPSDIADSYIKRKRQFRNCVESTGCKFLSANQPIIIQKPNLTQWEQETALPHIKRHPMKETHNRMEFLYEMYNNALTEKEKQQELRFTEMLEQNSDQSLFTDFVHTTPVADDLIAQTYAKHILSKMPW